MKYLVRLKPIDSFFFSGQSTFRFNNGKKTKDANHYVESEYYPQQTALLGMIKKELLIKKGWYRENRNDYAKDVGNGKLNSQSLYDLVGKGSFNPKDVNDFGVIKQMSPLYLYNKGNLYKENPFDDGLTFNLKKNDARLYLGNKKKKGTFLLEVYDPKKGREKKLVQVNNSKGEIKFSEVFKDDLRVGIDTNNDEAFYKQNFLKLKESWEFAFELELSEEVFEKGYNAIVYIGSESKPFRLLLEEVGQVSFEKNEIKGRIELLSDSIIRSENYAKIEELSYLILGDFKYFKNFRVVDGTYKDSNPMLLLKKGSVVFFEENNNNKIKELLINKEFQKIGYNHILGGDR